MSISRTVVIPTGLLLAKRHQGTLRTMDVTVLDYPAFSPVGTDQPNLGRSWGDAQEVTAWQSSKPRTVI